MILHNRLLFATLALMLVSAAASAEVAAFNGDFEAAGALPEGWSPVGGGSAGSESALLDGESHGGSRALHVKSVHGECTWASAPVQVEAGKKYIVSGYVKPASGAARLRVEFRDDEGCLGSTSKRRAQQKPKNGPT